MKVFTDISFWWLIPWGVVSALLAFWYYRRQKGIEEVTNFIRYSLTTIRGIVLFLIGLLLFGILVESKNEKVQPPVFITLVDNSSSMLNYLDSLSVKENIGSLKAKVKDEFKGKFEFVDLSVGAKVGDKEIDFSADISNLDAGFDYIYNQYYSENIGGILFISDGNYNQGKHPIYSAERIPLTPIFTVGVGDTVRKKDQLVKRVTTNDIAFLNNKFPVEIDIEANQMESGESEVSIWRGDKKLTSKTVELTGNERDFVHVSMMLEATTVGFVQYSVRLERKIGESTYENNEWSFYVEILDARNKILMLSEVPHPDIAAIKSVVERDENVEVVSQLVSEWDGKLNEYALLIWHNSGMNPSESLLSEIKKNNIPVLYIVGNQAKSNLVQQLGIGLSIPKRSRFDEAQGAVSNSFQLFELEDETKERIDKFPPLSVPFGGVEAKLGNVLVTQRIGPVTKSDPIIYFGSLSNQKFGVFVGEGIWRWKIHEFSAYNDNTAFQELIQKTVQYLTVKRNTDALRISMPKKFTENEDIVIQAEFYNASFDRIVEPDISFDLIAENGEEVKYEFAKNTEDYRLVLGKLKSGKYSWKAYTSYNGVKYEKNGVFVVEDISLEHLDTRANHALLKQLAAISNGHFFKIDQPQNLIDSINNRKDIVSVTYQESAYNDLIDNKWIFFILIFLLGMEWFLRRRNGTY